MIKIDRRNALRALHKSKKPKRARPFVTPDTIGYVCFDMLVKGTTKAELVREIRRRRGNVKYWLSAFRREEFHGHEWELEENKETGEMRIHFPL